MRRVILSEEASMPEWNWSEMFSLGVKLFGVYFIYSLPIFLPMIFGYFLMIIPAILLDPAIAGSDPLVPPVWGIIGGFGGIALFGIGMMLSMVLSFIIPPAITHAAAKNSFTAGFHIRDWWQIFKANAGGFILAVIITGGLYMVLIFAVQILYMTIILCFIVPFVMSAALTYWVIIATALFGLTYREGLDKIK